LQYLHSEATAGFVRLLTQKAVNSVLVIYLFWALNKTRKADSP